MSKPPEPAIPEKATVSWVSAGAQKNHRNQLITKPYTHQTWTGPATRKANTSWLQNHKTKSLTKPYTHQTCTEQAARNGNTSWLHPTDTKNSSPKQQKTNSYNKNNCKAKCKKEHGATLRSVSWVYPGDMTIPRPDTNKPTITITNRTMTKQNTKAAAAIASVCYVCVHVLHARCQRVRSTRGAAKATEIHEKLTRLS